MIGIRKFGMIGALAVLSTVPAFAQYVPQPPTIAAKSWYLLETSTGQALTSEKADERFEPASLTKLMTAYVTFKAIHNNALKIDQTLPVSKTAWQTGGSRTFVQVGTQVLVDDLIKGMIVQSGNDACKVLAEGIAGSEENFAQLMNREAARLGMKNTNFRNVTGLPDPQHYTTAHDLALLASALVRDFPAEYKKYYSMREFTYNNITQPNRNRLLWIDPTVDGMKTGFTDAAGYCLISSAKRGERRLISVLLGAKSPDVRTTESQKLLNWGYISYDAVPLFAKDKVAATPKVWKGEPKLVKAGFTSPVTVIVPKGESGKISSQLLLQARIMAPVQAGQRLGTLKVAVEGKPYGEYPVVALEKVPEAGFFGRMVDSAKLWMQ